MILELYSNRNYLSHKSITAASKKEKMIALDILFDAVFSFGVLHHLEDWAKAITEISRVLKVGGEFFFEEPFRSFLNSFFVRIFTRHPEGGKFDYEEFMDELLKNNIKVINLKRLGDIAIFGVGRKKLGSKEREK